MENFMKRPRTIFTRPIQEELGFGKTVTTAGRLMNADGTFNVQRQHLSPGDNIYFYLITMPWWKLLILAVLSYFLVNVIFTGLYLLIGIEQLAGVETGDFWFNFSIAYFFSTQTLTTVGYGHVYPVGWAANFVASLESFAGLLAFALTSGLLYGRFSRPTAKIVFSHVLLVAPYRDGQGVMLRMGNGRKSELIETEVQILLAMNQPEANGSLVRRFYALPLEISKISFFSLSWTVVHHLNEDSPLWGFSPQELVDANAEFMVLVKGTDEANQQLVHTRRSYTAEEMVWNARFQPVISRNSSGLPFVLNRQIGAYELIG